MQSIHFYITVFITLIGFRVLAQPVSDQPYDVMIETAQTQEAKGEYFNALDWYKQAYDESKDPELAIKMAAINEVLRDYKKASSWYRRVLRRDKAGKYLDYMVNYGRVLKYQGKYDEALKAFKEFINRSDNKSLIQQAELEAEGIALARSMEEDLRYTIKNAGKNVNTKGQEYSPFIDRDSALYFATMNLKEIKVLKDDKDREEQVVKIYVSAPDKKYLWGTPRALGDHINRPGNHTANVHISPDGNRMFFTRSVLSGDHIEESKAFVSHRTASGWGPAQELAGINGDYNVRHLSVGELYGDEVLFFSANMPGGKGGYDLYYATIKGENEYGIPTNLGQVINTSKDELTPFYQDGKLYFSSNGHPSLGGLDVYVSTWDGVKWSTPENLGMPFNSSVDDLYFSRNRDGSQGVIISNRPGTRHRSLKSKTCCDDIWMVSKREILIQLLASIKDDKGAPLKNVTVQIIDLSKPDDEPVVKGTGSKSYTKFSIEGGKAYKIIAKKEGYYPAEAELNTVGMSEEHTYKKEFVLKTKPPEVRIITINEPIRLNQIYYDYNDWKILPDAEKDLKVLVDLMNQYPEMVIELSSHTDARGTDAYNKKLSLKRAQSAKRWMIRHGIDGKRIKAVGYGEEKILNECVNGVDCTDEEHRFNRRTEFKILEGPTSITIKKEVLKK